MRYGKNLVYREARLASGSSSAKGRAGRADESPDLGRIFRALSYLDSRRDVDAEGLQHPDRLGDVVRSQSTGGNKTHRRSLEASKSGFGVEALPCPACTRIQQKQIDFASQGAKSLLKPRPNR